MRLSDLLNEAGLPARCHGGDADLTALTCDTRQIAPGACFVAIRGANDDGHAYIPAAVGAGAAAVVCEDPAAVPEGTPVAVVDDTRAAVGLLAQAMHGWPGRKLRVVGVTGTNGKTTVTWLLRHILSAAGHRPAMLGTIRYETGRRDVAAGTTTPDPISLAAMMAEMVDSGRTHLVMEVSSHALDQQRIAGVDLDVGVLTNVTSDHMDYHLTDAAYRRAKRRLFEALGASATAVINRDDPVADDFMAATQAPTVTYGLSEAADLWARIVTIDIHGTHMTLCGRGGETPFATPLIGRHNVYNALAAAAAAQALGVTMPVIASSLAEATAVPGRLQRVPSERPFEVFVDYAHTDDALSNVLSALRPVTQGRLIVVFGCGGDRDRTKRPRMGCVAETLADRLVITSDNPRSEPPEDIIEQIVGGLSDDGLARSTILPDRREAIAAAIAQAEGGDVVLIAGKGHETYQILGPRRVDFDDAAVAEEVLTPSGSRA